MSDNQFIPSSNLSFTEYKESLKEYLKKNRNFTDYDFEGSNITVLVDLLSYNTYNNGLYLNMVGSEAWVDSAQLRSSLVSHAKDLNYVPRSSSSAFCTLTIEVVPHDQPSSIVIPQFYKFRTSNSQGEVVYFITDEEVTLSRRNGRYIGNITVYQGEMVTEYYTVNGVTTTDRYTTYNQQFIIQSPNVDISSLRASVNGVGFTRAYNLFGVTYNSNVFFVNGHGDNKYSVEFGDGVFGSALIDNDIIEFNYRTTQGSNISGNYILTKTANIQGYENVTISNISRTTGGTTAESLESIRYNAPRYFQTQERAVVPQDYEVLLKNQFSFIQDISVFGGEDIFQYGKMMITIKPFGSVATLSNNLKNQIIQFIKTKNSITEPVILEPSYFYVNITGNLFTSTNVNVDDIKTKAIESLINLNDTALGGFNLNVYQSFINQTITDSDPRITGSDVNLTMVKQWQPNRGRVDSIKFTCDNTIVSSSIAYTSPNNYGVTTNTFYIMRNGVSTPVVIRDDGIGRLHINLVAENGQIVRPSNSIVGSIDYSDGTVELSIEVNDYDGSVDFHLTPLEDSIIITRDKFVLVDSRYINLEV